MKSFRITVWALLGCLLASEPSFGEFRTFFSTEGKKVTGKVVGVDGELVTLKRRDGKKFTVHMDKFSEGGRKYFKEYASKHAVREMIALKDFKVYGFSTATKGQKLDLNKGKVFDELKVTKGNKIRIHGVKKRNDNRVNGRLVLHCGKVVLFPASVREGTLEARQGSADDATRYFVFLELEDKRKGKTWLRYKGVYLKEKQDYTWTFEEEGEFGVLKVMEISEEGETEILRISHGRTQIVSMGFGATVRWKKNKADLAFTVK